MPMSSVAEIISRRAMKRGILAGLQHAGQVVQRRVDVRAADRLDERADDVVVLVAVAVVAHGGPVRRTARRRPRRSRRVPGRRRPRRTPPGRSARGGRRRRRAGGSGPALVGRHDTAPPRRAEAALVGRAPGRAGRRCRASVSGFSVSSSDRDSSGEMTENDGFSVVAAIRVTSRFSTAGSSTSCWALEKRCTSSTNSTVACPRASSRRAVVQLGADLLDAGGDGRQLDEAAVRGLRDDRGDGRLADPGRPPEEHRHRLPVGQPPQRRARREQVLLPDDLVEGPRPQPHGQRRLRVGGVAQRAAARGRGGVGVAEQVEAHRPPL